MVTPMSVSFLFRNVEGMQGDLTAASLLPRAFLFLTGAVSFGAKAENLSRLRYLDPLAIVYPSFFAIIAIVVAIWPMLAHQYGSDLCSRIVALIGINRCLRIHARRVANTTGQHRPDHNAHHGLVSRFEISQPTGQG